MQIDRVHIQNFRSLRDQTVNFGDQTIFIGTNGAGKSTILKAIQAFFDVSFKPSKEDYFAHIDDCVIEIELTFSGFSEKERESFSSHIIDDRMIVSRAFGKGENGIYRGVVLGCPDFKSVRDATKANDKRIAYQILIGNGYSLPNWTNQSDALSNLTQWEKDNPERCEKIKDDGQFLGFKGVGGGKLDQATNFILVEAVRDAAQDASDQKASAISQLMDLVVRSAMKAKVEISNYQERINKEYRELVSDRNFPELRRMESQISDTLSLYYQDISVRLDWRDDIFVNLPVPQAEIRFEENQFEYPVAKAGNGVQRALIISLLQHLYASRIRLAEMASSAGNPDDFDIAGLPNIILAIEEPELYQHPAKQHHFAKVLRNLSTGEKESGLGRVQVIFCTHSPSFVHFSDFASVRVARKQKTDDNHVSETVFRQPDTRFVAEKIRKAWNNEDATENSMVSRLNIFGSDVSRGLFSDGVILVEGVSDKEVFECVAEKMGVSFAAHNVDVIAVSGKSCLDRCYAVYHEMGVPVYIIWDSDSSGKSDQIVRLNKALQSLLGVSAKDLRDFPSGIYEEYACFYEDMNHTLKEDFGDEAYNNFRDEICKENMMPPKKGEKNNYILRLLIERAYSSGKRAETIEAVVKGAFDYLCVAPNVPSAK